MTFTAVADCPECGSLDVHWLDESKPAPTEDDYRDWTARHLQYISNPGTQVVAFGGQVVRCVGRPAPPPPLVDESAFEVMRVCTSCSHRWGEE